MFRLPTATQRGPILQNFSTSSYWRLERKEVHQPWTLGSQILPNISFPRLSQILSTTPDITVQIQVILSSHLIL